MLPVSPLEVAGGADRLVGRLRGAARGPTLICIAGLHGNEQAGLAALRAVFRNLADGPGLKRGDFVAFAGNLDAVRRGVRFVDRDLNRHWSERRLAEFASVPAADLRSEDLEQRQLLDSLRITFSRARGPVHVLDLHSMSGAGRPFTVFADTLRCRLFAQQFPNPLILGLEEHVEGTLVEFLASRGHIALAFEGGQHRDPETTENLQAAVWVALGATGLLDRAYDAEVSQARRFLRSAKHDVPSVLEVRHRHAVAASDAFAMHPGFGSFDRVREGQRLARDQTGEILAPLSGYLLLPLYQPQGDDGFFVVSPVRRHWLTVSRWLRRARVDRVAHHLPGVRRDPAAGDVLIVNRRVARWFALEILHLLGYRKLEDDGATLRVQHRKYDYV